MFDAMEKASNGRLVIERHAADSLVSSEDLFSAVSSGAVDISAATVGRWSGKFAPGLGDLGFLPLGWSNPTDFVNLFYEKGIKEIYEKAYAAHGIYLLGAHGGNAQLTLQTTFPVHSIEDMKGRKLRTSGAFAQFVTDLGGTSASTPPGEVYMALKLGTIEGLFWSLPELEGMKMKEVVKYVMLPGFLSPPTDYYMVNMKAWNALPADLQQALQIAVKDGFMPVYEKLDELDQAALKTASGVEIITISDAELARFREVALGSWETLGAKSAEAKAVLDIYKAYYNMK
jgi:TRAP-type mannitol/chloroaromatic compound transport system substrate-binding protein